MIRDAGKIEFGPRNVERQEAPGFAWGGSPHFDPRTRKAATRGVPVVQRIKGARLETVLDGRNYDFRLPVGIEGVKTLANDATPSVEGGGMWQTGGTTAITDFDDGKVGDILYLEAKHSVTITHGSPIQLNGDANYDMVSGDTLILAMFDDQVWVEIARGGQSASGGGGAKCATLVIGPSSNSDSADYDYVTDGTDDDVQIQAAIDALPTNGGMILLREGTYTISTQVNANDINITIQGMGGGTILQPGASSGDITLIASTGNYFHLRNLNFDGSNNTTDNVTALTVSAIQPVIENCRFDDFSFAAIVSTLTQDSEEGQITNCYFSECYAISAWNGSIDGCFFTTTSTSETFVDGEYNSSVTNSVFVLPNSYNSTVLDTVHHVRNCIFSIGTSAGSSCVILKGNGDKCVAEGNSIIFGATANVSATAVSSFDHANNNYIVGAGTAFSGANGSRLVYCGNYMINLRAYAFVSFGDDTLIANNYVEDSGLATSDTYSTVVFNNNADHCIVSGNLFINNTGSAHYVIEETTGCDNNIITSNVATGGVTGQINVVGGSTVSTNNITA